MLAAFFLTAEFAKENVFLQCCSLRTCGFLRELCGSRLLPEAPGTQRTQPTFSATFSSEGESRQGSTAIPGEGGTPRDSRQDAGATFPGKEHYGEDQYFAKVRTDTRTLEAAHC